MNKFNVSLVLPCYNESEIFENSVERIIKTLKRSGYTWEIIFVEDQSSDDTVELIKKALKKYSHDSLSAYFHHRNLGRGKTVVDGFRRAQGKYVGFIDIDLETGEWYLSKFVDVLEDGADAALAWRIYDFQLWSLPRWFASKGYVWLRKQLLGLPFQDTEGGYKFFRRRKIMPLLKKIKNKGWFFDTEIMAQCFKAKLKVGEIPVAFVKNKNKTSTVRLIPDSINYLWNLIKFSREFKYTNEK